MYARVFFNYFFDEREGSTPNGAPNLRGFLKSDCIGLCLSLGSKLLESFVQLRLMISDTDVVFAV